MAEHELDFGVSVLQEQLVEAREHLAKRAQEYRKAADQLALAEFSVKGLEVAIAALESVKS